MQPEAHLYALRQWAIARIDAGLDVEIVTKEHGHAVWTESTYRGNPGQYTRSGEGWSRDHYSPEQAKDEIRRAIAVIVEEGKSYT